MGFHKVRQPCLQRRRGCAQSCIWGFLRFGFVEGEGDEVILWLNFSNEDEGILLGFESVLLLLRFLFGMCSGACPPESHFRLLSFSTEAYFRFSKYGRKKIKSNRIGFLLFNFFSSSIK